MGLLYAKDGKLYANEYLELYIPKSYFTDNLARNNGLSIETWGLVYIRNFKNDKPQEFQMMNLPVIVNYMLYDFDDEIIHIKGKEVPVMTLKYPKDSYIMHQSTPNGKDIAELFLDAVINGKLPDTLNYTHIPDLWWKNLRISGVSFKVPSKIYEILIAAVYRNPDNVKERYGQKYGRENNPSGYDYETGNIRNIVKSLSTFAGMTFEDIGAMITNGINNSIDNIEEPVSPLEKIIHY